MDSFQARSLVTSMLGAPKVMPRCSDSRAEVMVWAACSSALDGMQPRFKQTPPSTLLALDQDDFLAQVRRVKGRGITARACAHNYDFSFNRFHRKLRNT